MNVHYVISKFQLHSCMDCYNNVINWIFLKKKIWNIEIAMVHSSTFSEQSLGTSFNIQKQIREALLFQLNHEKDKVHISKWFSLLAINLQKVSSEINRTLFLFIFFFFINNQEKHAKVVLLWSWLTDWYFFLTAYQHLWSRNILNFFFFQMNIPLRCFENNNTSSNI